MILRRFASNFLSKSAFSSSYCSASCSSWFCSSSFSSVCSNHFLRSIELSFASV
ncbi:Uncharacterised protein [Vibrio cholerae]|nr:Uncharacterised protein [Vibrio cholerae]